MAPVDPSTFTKPPPPTSIYSLAFPRPGVLLVTIRRPRQMNSIPMAGHWEADAIWTWMDEEPSMIVGIITGEGSKSFSAGADLLEQRDRRAGPPDPRQQTMAASGFGGLSRRLGKKPVIAAVNGFALGGGFEICLGCDIVVASPTASFGLPEALRGIYAGAGGLSRLVRICGMQLASEIAMAGRRLSAEEAKSLHVVNIVTKSPESLMEEALEVAGKIASLSPDAVIVTRSGLRESWETASVERASQITAEKYGRALMTTENTRIGLEAFAKKQQPKWVGSKL